MRILLDEQLPRQLAREFVGHQVRTVQQQGWSGVRNSELLQRAAAEPFDVFMTADRGFAFQQNLTRTPLRVIILLARSNSIRSLQPLVPALLQAIQNAKPGDLLQINRP